MKFLYLLSLLSSVHIVVAAGISGKVTDTKGAPVPGVNIYWQNSGVGTVSDHNGEFVIERREQSGRLIFSNVAFKKDTVHVTADQQVVNRTLQEVIELQELQVVQTSPGTFKSRFTALQTEKITAHELTKAACCNLSESFETNP